MNPASFIAAAFLAANNPPSPLANLVIKQDGKRVVIEGRNFRATVDSYHIDSSKQLLGLNGTVASPATFVMLKHGRHQKFTGTRFTYDWKTNSFNGEDVVSFSESD